MEIRESLRKLFRYELNKNDPIGGGGCGQVWAARDLLFDRGVAIKTINEILFWDYPEEARRSFIKEAIAGARLGAMSRHIVKVYDFGVTDNIPFFVMEWIEPETGSAGINLSPLIGEVSLARTKQILFETCEALELV